MKGAEERDRLRVHGRVGRDPGAFLLRDLDTETARWAAPGDSGGRRVWPGMILEGVVENTEGRPDDGDRCLRLTDWHIETRDSLAVARCDGGVPEAVWDAWDQRRSGQRRVTTVLPGPCEVHVSVPAQTVAPETLFERMLTGRFSFEPWFESLVELDGSAAHLTVVSSTDRSPFV
jgi:hypothetical protein